jgi:N,N'-diacetyllegionaminate synthase|tara:strand:- start:1503 stop:2309 length:807 start_codon:yes stop_codon:yes gene_type:complete
MIKKLELDRNAHEELVTYCNQKNIQFLSTAFDHDSIDLLAELGIPFYKIPSGEIINLTYLRHVGSMGKPVVMSTGMATLEEVRAAMEILLAAGVKKDDLTILHCNTEYPTPIENVNLKAMLTIRDELGVKVGYSDHTLGIEIPVAAVAMGATVIEKHFTLDRILPGPDHAASLEPDELKAMIQAIRNIEKAMGNGVKQPSPSEAKNIPIARKSIVAKKPINKGERFSEDNLTVKRPGTGISPMEWDKKIGELSNKEYKAEDLIENEII